jgi:hypothetical protein
MSAAVDELELYFADGAIKHVTDEAGASFIHSL